MGYRIPKIAGASRRWAWWEAGRERAERPARSLTDGELRTELAACNARLDAAERRGIPPEEFRRRELVGQRRALVRRVCACIDREIAACVIGMEHQVFVDGAAIDRSRDLERELERRERARQTKVA